MKSLITLLLASMALVSSCSSPQERHESRQVEAKEQYNEDLKQSQEQLEEDELNAEREEAKDMIDDSDSVNVDEDDDSIQLED